MAATLDRVNLSDRKATFVVSFVIQSLGMDISQVNVSRSTIRRTRMSSRISDFKTIKDNFIKQKPMIVHWDGKLMTDLVGHKKVDRLPVIVTGADNEQLLGVPKLNSSTGEEQANAVVELLKEWDIMDYVSGICFDTTASNTGRLSGACKRIEDQLGKPLLYLACRHHINELVLKVAFEKSMNIKTSGPEVQIFKRFQNSWPNLDKSKYKNGLKDTFIFESLSSFGSNIEKFCRKQLEVLSIFCSFLN